MIENEGNLIVTENNNPQKSDRERGASLVEYALLVALIAVVAIVAIKSLGSSVSGQFSYIGSQVN